LPFSEFYIRQQFSELENSLPSVFGRGSRVSQVEQSRWVIEKDDRSRESAIPTLQMIDAAFQEVEHFPGLMERVTRDYGELGQFIEACTAEIERLRAAKERMATQNSVLRERIRKTQEQSREFAAARAAILQKMGPSGT
jgi:hypothetical protein